MKLTTWIMRADADEPSKGRCFFNLLARAPDSDTAIAVGIAELGARGCVNIEILRIGEISPDARSNADEPFLKALVAVDEWGFSIVRYGSLDS